MDKSDVAKATRMIPDWAKITHKEMYRDDFIEYILNNTEDSTTFRIGESNHYIHIGIDRPSQQQD